MPAPRASAAFRFYEELNDHLPPTLRKREFPVAIDRARSVKDAIESVGVPHTEVDLILVDGASVGFGHVLRGGERVAVYPQFERFDIAPVTRLRERPLRDPRFVADTHLAKLARHLRMAGFDCLWDNDWSDEHIVTLSIAERRTILTRDRGILRRRVVERGYFVRNVESERQLVEVVRGLQLETMVRPFTRCRECNVLLEPASRETVGVVLPPRVRAMYERFQFCSGCKRVYWEGTHYKRLKRVLDRLAEPERS
jgi:uncharacterized protein with PIN domain